MKYDKKNNDRSLEPAHLGSAQGHAESRVSPTMTMAEGRRASHVMIIANKNDTTIAITT